MQLLKRRDFRVLILLFAVMGYCAFAEQSITSFRWQTVETQGQPQCRHECAFTACAGKLYLIGGRRIQPVNVYDLKTNQWTNASKPPVEIHHFQPVIRDGKIYLFGVMTGKYPNETPLPNVLIYDPATDAWSQGAEIPEDRRRGSCGVVLHNGKIYMVCGIREGHQGGFVPWLDEYDPVANTWRRLADAPRPRDHFAAVVIEGKIYVAGGRRTSKRTGQVFNLTIPEVDVYDIQTNTWATLTEDLPTQRAGTSTVAWDGKLLVIGGESAQKQAHNQVQMYDPAAKKWQVLSPLVRGRHGTGAVVLDGKIYTCAGSGGQGGGPELTSLEVFAP